MGAAICWMSILQACVTLSTAEAEMTAMSKMAQEVIWVRRFISELLGADIKVPTTIHCDNTAALALVDNRVHHARTKHIKLRQNFIREHKETGELNPVYIDTASNIADSFTKVVPPLTLEGHYLSITGMEVAYSV